MSKAQVKVDHYELLGYQIKYKQVEGQEPCWIIVRTGEKFPSKELARERIIEHFFFGGRKL